jgi:NADH-quinone oxidoreductase subunit E
MLDLAFIRALEVASFYFMFQLQPVGSVAHVQVCGTLSCMICGAEDLISVCKDKIADKAHALSADGKFSWEEVECLGSCANAPMAQIGKDYYEDLTAARLGEIIDELAAGRVPTPGPQNGRFAAEPLKGLTSLRDYDSGKTKYNASAQLATDIGDTVKRIDGTEVPLLTPWIKDAKAAPSPKAKATTPKPKPAKKAPAKAAPAAAAEVKPDTLDAPRATGADDLKQISGVGPKLEGVLNDLGFWHFDQIAKWTADEIAWVDSRLKFKGRIIRDDWMAQAAALAKAK